MINAYNMYSWSGFSNRIVHRTLIHTRVSCCFQALGFTRWHHQAAALLASPAALPAVREDALNLIFFFIFLKNVTAHYF